jgi:hypothetical protein
MGNFCQAGWAFASRAVCTVELGWAHLLLSNTQRIFQFFNYLPNVFEHENTKCHLTDVQNFPNMAWWQIISN